MWSGPYPLPQMSPWNNPFKMALTPGFCWSSSSAHLSLPLRWASWLGALRTLVARTPIHAFIQGQARRLRWLMMGICCAVRLAISPIESCRTPEASPAGTERVIGNVGTDTVIGNIVPETEPPADAVEASTIKI